MITIPPAATPPALTLPEAKLHLRVDHTAEDSLIAALMTAATAAAEHETGRQLVTQEWQTWLSGWPSADTIGLAQTPVSGVVVKYTGPAGDEQTLAASDYVLIPGVVPAIIRTSKSWPALSSSVPYPVRITATAGYGPAAAVPEPIRAWVKCVLGALYLNRESTAAGAVAELPYIARLLDRYRTWRA